MATVKSWSSPTSRSGQALFNPRTGRPLSNRQAGKRPDKTARELAQEELDRRTRQQAEEQQAQQKAIDEANKKRIQAEENIKKLKEVKKEVEIKKRFELQRGKEIYNPELRGYTRYSEPSGQATAYTRIVQPEELKRIEEAQFRGSPKGIKKAIVDKAEEIRDYKVFKKIRESKAVKKLKELELPKPRREVDRTLVELPKKGTDVLAEGTLRTGETVGAWWTKELEKENRSQDWMKLKPIKRETAKEIISTGYLFAGFEPLMRTGTSQQMAQSEYVYDYKRGRYVTKRDLQNYLERAEIKGTQANIGKSISYQEKANRLRTLLDKSTNKDQAREIMKLAKESYGDDFLRDFSAQEYGFIPKAPKVEAPTIKPSSPTPPKDIFTGTSGAELKGVSAIETASSKSVWYGTGQYETTDLKPRVKTDTKPDSFSKVGETNWVKSSDKIGSNVFEDVNIDNKQKSGQINLLGSGQGTKNKTKQRDKQKSDQDTSQDTKQDTKQGSLTKSLTSLANSMDQPLKQEQGRRGRDEDYLRRPRKQKTPKYPLLPPEKSSLAKRLLKKIESEGFEVFGKRFGKDISLGMFSNKRRAEKKLKSFLEGTLGRSGYLEKSGRKVKTNLGSMFRPSKKDPLRVVQKAKYSLGSGSERKEIQYFKKKAKKSKSSKKFKWL